MSGENTVRASFDRGVRLQVVTVLVMASIVTYAILQSSTYGRRFAPLVLVLAVPIAGFAYVTSGIFWEGDRVVLRIVRVRIWSALTREVSISVESFRGNPLAYRIVATRSNGRRFPLSFTYIEPESASLLPPPEPLR
jgi:hypothetical protein